MACLELKLKEVVARSELLEPSELLARSGS
jgi:hypothetical protein